MGHTDDFKSSGELGEDELGDFKGPALACVVTQLESETDTLGVGWGRGGGGVGGEGWGVGGAFLTQIVAWSTEPP